MISAWLVARTLVPGMYVGYVTSRNKHNTYNQRQEIIRDTAFNGIPIFLGD